MKAAWFRSAISLLAIAAFSFPAYTPYSAHFPRYEARGPGRLPDEP